MTREQSKAWPEVLAPVPEGEWPAPRGRRRPVAVWLSRHYLAALYALPLCQAGVVRRLSVNRVALGIDGRWEQGISWDELMRCKRETGHADWYGVEVYPRDRDIVNDANMRHLWLLTEPLPIGWFPSEAKDPLEVL